MKISQPKEFKTLTQQFDILVKQRKLKPSQLKEGSNPIDDLKEVLLDKNYFDLVNGLEDLINSSDSKNKFYGEYSVYDLVSLYDLNKDVRQLLLEIIGEFEIKLKTVIAYYFSACNLEWNSYCNPSNYRKVTRNDTDYVFRKRYGYSISYKGSNPKVSQNQLFPFFYTDDEVIEKFHKKKRYLKSYGGQPPLWVAIKALDFGNLHFMFSILNSEVASQVLATFNFELKERNKFESILYVVNWLRNECAHFEMINKSRYHGSQALNKDLLEQLNLRTNRSRRNLTLFQTICILNSVRDFKERFECLIIDADVQDTLKRKYLRSIGYWRQSGWNFNLDF